MSLSRRNLLAFTGAAAVLGGAAACGTSGGGGGGGESGGDLSILTPIFEDAEGKKTLEETIAGSLDEDVSLKVDYTPWDKLNEKLSTSIAGGMSTDIFMSGVGWIPPFAHKGVFAPLDDSILEGLDIHEKLLDMCRYDGVLHALPYQMDGRMIMGNRALMEERGISEIPTSLEDLREMLKEAQGGGIEAPLDLFSNNIRQTWVHLVSCFGGSLFTEDGSAVAFDDGTGEAALQYMLDLIADGSTNFDLRTAEGQPRPWQQERVVFELTGSAIWPDLFSQTPEMITEDAMEIALLPGSAGNDPVMFLGGTLVSIGERAREPELAERFMTNLFTPENLAAAAVHGGRVPAVNTLPEDPVLAENRFITFVSDNLDHAGGDEGGSPAWMELRGALNPEIEAAMTGSQSPADTIARLKQTADDAISRL
jgi:multiple sugar transport system substrate-binding protein